MANSARCAGRPGSVSRRLACWRSEPAGATAVFTLIDSVMLRPLPVSDPARLYRIGDGDDTVATGRHGRWGVFSFGRCTSD